MSGWNSFTKVCGYIGIGAGAVTTAVAIVNPEASMVSKGVGLALAGIGTGVEGIGEVKTSHEAQRNAKKADALQAKIDEMKSTHASDGFTDAPAAAKT